MWQIVYSINEDVGTSDKWKFVITLIKQNFEGNKLKLAGLNNYNRKWVVKIILRYTCSIKVAF